MFAVVSMRFLIPKNPGFLDTMAFRVHLGRTGTDGFKRDRLPISKQTINRRFYQINCPLPPGFHDTSLTRGGLPSSVVLCLMVSRGSYCSSFR